MAYVSKEKKAKIVAAVKKVLPKAWKVTFRVENHSTMICTVREAPANILRDYLPSEAHGDTPERILSGETAPRRLIVSPESAWTGKTLDTVKAILAGLNTDNHDRSDSMTDYFDVGHYVSLQFGDWDKPCRWTGTYRPKKPVEPSQTLTSALQTLLNQTPPRNPHAVTVARRDETKPDFAAAIRSTRAGAMLSERAINEIAAAVAGVL